ncbi:tRNA (N(6)-L-threonylcarbamoyladenosine(37)-C(2))-methylthiotransferase MtaB [Peptococcaceae bacterium 1198_IL3148]
MKKVAIHTLGCKVNQTESAAIGEMFKEHGYLLTEFGQPADVYIINTCTVTHLGDRKSRQMIRRAAKINPQGLIVVTGCYAQTSPGEVMEIPGVDLVVGTADKNKIVQLVEQEVAKPAGPVNAVLDVFQQHEFQELPTVTESGKTRAFIKVQEGCNNYCAYCIIPYARGPLRSRSLTNVVEEVHKLVKEGFKEVVLTGIHTGAYGLDFKDGTELSTLIKELVHINGLKRLRLSSVEPNDITPELIGIAQSSKVFCNHLHIPMQSGDDQVLKSMGRRYTTKHFEQLIADIRNQIPDIAITTDVIVGFPGETEELFENTYKFCQKMAFSGIHVFKYSPRKGTRAADFPNQVAAEQKEKRSHRLIALGQQMAKSYAERFLGQTVEVLVEQPVKDNPGCWEGLTETYLRVEFSAIGDLHGQLVQVRLKEQQGDKLFGKLNQ